MDSDENCENVYSEKEEVESNVDEISPITADVSFQIRDYSIDKI